MIRLIQLGAASVSVPHHPYSSIDDPYVNETPQYFATITVNQNIPAGTILFAAFSNVWPNKFSDYDPSQVQFLTTDIPVFDSKGNSWSKSQVNLGDLHGEHLYKCIVTTPLVANVDTISACRHASMEDPGPQYGYGDYVDQVMGVRFFGFSCITDLVTFRVGGGNEWTLHESLPEEVTDLTPTGGEPLNPRLEVYFVGTGAIYNPEPIDGFRGEFGVGDVTTPEGQLPSVDFVPPSDWISVGTVSAEGHGQHFPTPSNPGNPPNLNPELSPVDLYYNDKVYYRFIQDGDLNDEVVLPGIDFGAGGYFMVHRGWALFSCREIPCPGEPGMDLVQTSNTWLFRSRVIATEVVVERSVDAGANWGDPVTVFDGVSAAVPTLAADRWDTLQCWFHDSSGDTHVYKSTDYGNTWSLVQTHVAVSFPRAKVASDKTFVVWYDGDSVKLYYSTDGGSSVTIIPGLSIECPEQLAAIAVDNDEILHLILQEQSGALVHRYSANGSTWDASNVLASNGNTPSYALGSRSGIIVWWDSALMAAILDETGGYIEQAVTPPTDYSEGQLGAIVNHREEPYLVGIGSSSSAALTKYSGDDGHTWSTPQ